MRSRQPISGRELTGSTHAIAEWAPAVVAVFFCVLSAYPTRIPCDDAFISFRYARNLVEGYGLVYNEIEYVEGITNLLWTLIVAGGVGIGFDAADFSRQLEPLIACAVLVLTFVYARLLIGRRAPQLWRSLAPAAAAFAVLAAPGFGYWTTAGLGEGLFMASVLAAVGCEASGRRFAVASACMLATLVRPEGVILAAALFGFQPIRGRGGIVRLLGPAACYALAILGLTAFRLWYYGSPLPNTFFAKVGGIPMSRGVDYLVAFLRSGAWPLVLVAAWPALTDDRVRPAAAYVVLTSLYVVAIGGDVFPLSRFLLPVLPVVAALAAFGVTTLLGRNALAGAVVSLLIPASMLLHVSGTMLPESPSFGHHRRPAGRAG